MSEYEKQRDEKLDHPCRQTCSGWQQGFERGEEKANARAEKRIQELEQKLTNQEQLNQKLAEGNSVLYKQKAELEKQVQGLVEALESIAAEKCDPSFDEVLPRLERGKLISIIDTDTAIARQALAQATKGEQDG